MPKSDERFARQYRFRLPSEFPLTSSCSGIVHHLSGPSSGALVHSALDRPATDVAASRAHFHCALGFATLRLAPLLDSLVRVSRRVSDSRFRGVSRSSLDPCGSTPRFRLSRPRFPVGPRLLRSASSPAAIASSSTVSSLLTLFSKFFSSFLHSTCSLSVSHRYLALEEVYLPL